jgi:hypothetical protein
MKRQLLLPSIIIIQFFVDKKATIIVDTFICFQWSCEHMLILLNINLTCHRHRHCLAGITSSICKLKFRVGREGAGRREWRPGGGAGRSARQARGGGGVVGAHYSQMRWMQRLCGAERSARGLCLPPTIHRRNCKTFTFVQNSEV